MTVSVVSAPDEAAVYRNADAVFTQRASSFYWARRFLSARHSERATRLYGFCRQVDDLADDRSSVGEAQSALLVVREALESGRSDNPALMDMLLLMRECGIDRAIPLDLVTGVQGDLTDVRVADMEELLRYCYRVAGTVGLMMTAALDVTAPQALPHAIDLGIAMQLTNICRDVREDALNGRRYLPATLVGSIEPVALIDPAGEMRAQAVNAVATLLDLADGYYARGEAGLAYLPGGARFGILVAARLYRAIGGVLRRRECDCWTSRARVGTLSKVAVTVRALAAVPRAARVAETASCVLAQAVKRPSVGVREAGARFGD
jgi:phytoene synthase